MKTLIVTLAFGLSSLAFAQRTQPCKEAAIAVALGKMAEKFGEHLSTFNEPEAFEQVAPNGREYFTVAFGKNEIDGEGFGRLTYTSVLVTTWDPEMKTGKYRCVISNVFGPVTEDTRDDLKPLPDDPR